MTERYEAVIGLEVHAQLNTRTKIFCGCPTTFGAPPNSQTCPVCLGHPGALPVLNLRAVELAVRAALALGSRVAEHSRFARKNYFYPDLPKGYQISQYEQPLATGGAVGIERGAERRAIDLARLHLEEDAGKSIHDGLPGTDRWSYVDLNRAGVPLVEIVTRPALHDAEEAYLLLQRLRSILRYAGVCDGNMEEGSLRCDANVSVRPRGQAALGTRTELKNLNSMRNVQRAIEHELERQIGVIAAGGTVTQETVAWDPATGETRPLRGKEEAHDYRYFPEPDLPPLVLRPEWVEEQRARLPELPGPRKERLILEYALAAPEAQLLTLEPGLADYFERVATASGNAKAAANFILNDLLRAQPDAGREAAAIAVSATDLAELIRLIDEGAVSITAARRVLFVEMVQSGRPPRELLSRIDVGQVSDEDALRTLVRRVLDEHPAQLAQYRGGKSGLFGYFVGLAMKASAGKANPQKLHALLEEELR